MQPKNQGKPNLITRIFRNFRMQTQILIINFLILCVIIPLVIVIQQINTQIINEYLKDSQEDILFLQNSRHVENVMNSFQYQIKFFYQKTQNSLYKVNSLYKYVQKTEIQFQENIKKCYDSNEDEIYPEDSKYPLFCVSTFKASQSDPLPNTKQYKVFSDFDLILDETLLMFDPTSSFLPDNIYIALDDNLETSAWWPQWVKWEGYHPQERPWYLQHKEKFIADPLLFDQISDLYEFYTDKPVMAMTATHTLNSNGQFEGVIASDIELDYNYFKQDSLNLMLIDLDGTLIITNYENKNIASSMRTYKFYDSQVTGFNQDDWNQIQLYLDKQNFVSNCQRKNYPQILCRFNEITQQDVIFSIRLLDNPKYIIIIFNNMTLEYEVMQNSRNLLNDLNQSFFFQFALSMLVIILLLILQTVVIWKLFHPLYQLIMHSKIYIKSNSNKLLFRQEQYYLSSLSFSPYFGSNVITTLKVAYKSIYNRLCSQTMKKCVQCQLLQKYQYPKRPRNLQKIRTPEQLEQLSPIEQPQILNLIKRALIVAQEQK